MLSSENTPQSRYNHAEARKG